MANNAGRPKTKVNENINTNLIVDNEKEELLKKNKEQENEISNLTKQNEESMSALLMLQKQMQEMQAAFVKMQSNTTTINTNNNINKKYELGCRIINGISLYSPNREVDIRINYQNTVEVTQQEIDMLLKSPFVREFLRKDVVFLTNEEDYDILKIYNRLDLSDKKLTNMVLNYNSNQLMAELTTLTRDKKDDPLMHSIFYRIVELYSKGDIARMTYENRKAIENFFKFSIESAQMLTERIKKII